MRTRLLFALLAFSVGTAWAGPAPKTRLIVGFSPEVSEGERLALARGAGMDVVEGLEPFNALVVESPGGLFHPNAMRLRSARGVEVVEEDFYIKWIEEAPPGFAQAALPSLAEIREALPRFSPRGIRDLAAPKADEPPDATIGELPWGIRKVNAPSAWDQADPRSLGTGVRVAVIDTGVDCGHPDLSCSYSEGYNAVDSRQPPKDDNEHGTHVAGTIAAKWDAKGVVGVAPGARIIPVKVLDKNGGGLLTTVIKGIVWCAKNDIPVANISLGAPRGSIFMHLAVMYAKKKGVTIVAAAGNNGPDQNSVGYPGGYAEAIGISATDAWHRLAFFSSRGPQVDFAAPGLDVYSTVPGGGWAKHSGTSMATPHGAGLAAIAVAYGAKGFDGVLAALKAAAAPLPGLAPTDQGSGFIDAARLVKRR